MLIAARTARVQKPVVRTLAAAPGMAITEIAYRPGETQPRHHHAASSVTLVLAGGIEERVGAACEMGRPLSVVVKPAGTEHANRVGPHGAVTIQVSIRRDCLADRPLHAWRWLHGDPAARPFFACLAAARAERSDTRMIEALVIELLASLPADHHRNVEAPPRWLERVAEVVDDTFAAAPRVDVLARDVGVHPVYLARRFRQHYGTSITERIRRRRVERAAGLLGGSRTPLSAVAYESGFADQSHLSRVFRRATGLTPGRYRTLAHG